MFRVFQNVRVISPWKCDFIFCYPVRTGLGCSVLLYSISVLHSFGQNYTMGGIHLVCKKYNSRVREK
jgi:hypothetical protein